MFKKIVLGIAIVAVLAGVFVPWIEVPSVNPHQGAVGYTIPFIKTHTLPLGTDGKSATYTFATDPATTPTQGHIDAAFPLTKFTAPAPLHKSPWDLYFSASFSRPQQLLPGDTGGGTDGSSCATTTTDVTWSKSVKVKITSTAPDGKIEMWNSAVKKVDITATKSTRSCTLGSSTTTTVAYLVKSDAAIEWTVGTFYLTHGTGNYYLRTEMFDVTDAANPYRVSYNDKTIVVPGDWTGK